MNSLRFLTSELIPYKEPELHILASLLDYIPYISSNCRVKNAISYDFHAYCPSLQHTPVEQLDRKHFAKGSHRPEQNGAPVAPKEADNSKEIALLEAKLRKMCELLHEVRICRFNQNQSVSHFVILHAGMSHLLDLSVFCVQKPHAFIWIII